MFITACLVEGRGYHLDIMRHDSFVKDQLLDSDMRIVFSCTSIIKQCQCRLQSLLNHILNVTEDLSPVLSLQFFSPAVRRVVWCDPW